jgi:hypothetical protein
LIRWRNRLPPESNYAELVSAPTTLPMDYATEADDMGPTRASQIPRWESQHQSHPQVAPQFTRPQPLVSKPCDHTADMIPRSMNVNPPNRFSRQNPATLK